MSKNKRLDNKGKNPRGRPRKIQRTLTGAIRRRPQPEEETSAANPEPQRQAQTNGGTRQQEDPLIIEID